jgi:hypothetical protein
MKKLTLARFLLRPIDTFKHTYKIFKTIELNATVHVKDGQKEEDLPPGGYVVYSSLAFPVETWRLIKPSLIKVDYSYTTGGKMWEIKDDPHVHTNVLTKDEMTALHVAKRFKDAS